MIDPIAYLENPAWKVSKPGLGRIAELMRRLDRPDRAYRIVHVAGTNGKGSVAAFASSILQSAGYRVGLFTSPAIGAYTESILVGGEPISVDDLRAAADAVCREAEAMDDHPTEFELMTAVALVHFARRACDIAVVEAGMGGRLDSTNVIDSPEVSVIARIGLDHTAFLGSTLAAVAGEKAGIIKPGTPVVSWPQEPEAMAVIEKVAAEYGNDLVAPDFNALDAGGVSREMPVAGEALGACGASGISDASASFDALEMAEAEDSCDSPGMLVRSFSYRGELYRTRLLGGYQPANAALAIETARVLRERGWRIGAEAVREGIARAEWPGRFEVLADPAPGASGRLIVIDGGHNPQGARALADSLDEVFPGRKPVFIIGVLEDKDYPEMLEAVLPLGAGFVVVAPDNPRALPAGKLARAIRWTGQDLLGCSACVNPKVARDMSDAVAKAREMAGPGPESLICAFGSLYSIGALRAAL